MADNNSDDDYLSDPRYQILDAELEKMRAAIETHRQNMYNASINFFRERKEEVVSRWSDYDRQAEVFRRFTPQVDRTYYERFTNLDDAVADLPNHAGHIRDGPARVGEDTKVGHLFEGVYPPCLKSEQESRLILHIFDEVLREQLGDDHSVPLPIEFVAFLRCAGGICEPNYINDPEADDWKIAMRTDARWTLDVMKENLRYIIFRNEAKESLGEPLYVHNWRLEHQKIGICKEVWHIDGYASLVYSRPRQVRYPDLKDEWRWRPALGLPRDCPDEGVWDSIYDMLEWYSKWDRRVPEGYLEGYFYDDDYAWEGSNTPFD